MHFNMFLVEEKLEEGDGLIGRAVTPHFCDALPSPVLKDEDR